MSKFKIGDRVVMIKDSDEYCKKGMVGIIIYVDTCPVKNNYIRFDEKFEDGHTLWGKCEDGYGYCVSDDEIELEKQKTVLEVLMNYYNIKKGDKFNILDHDYNPYTYNPNNDDDDYNPYTYNPNNEDVIIDCVGDSYYFGYDDVITKWKEPEVVEMTIKQICEKLGKNIKIIMG